MKWYIILFEVATISKNKFSYRLVFYVGFSIVHDV